MKKKLCETCNRQGPSPKEQSPKWCFSSIGIWCANTAFTTKIIMSARPNRNEEAVEKYNLIVQIVKCMQRINSVCAESEKESVACQIMMFHAFIEFLSVFIHFVRLSPSSCFFHLCLGRSFVRSRPSIWIVVAVFFWTVAAAQGFRVLFIVISLSLWLSPSPSLSLVRIVPHSTHHGII